MKSIWRFITLAIFFTPIYVNAAKFSNYGGTNHFISSYGTTDGIGTNQSWYVPAANIKPPVGTYHLNSIVVDQQIAALKASGQTSYVITIFNLDIGSCYSTGACNDGLDDGVWGEVIDNSNYLMRPQHRDNLKKIVGKALDNGMKRIIIRFGYNSASSTWSAWDEKKYQQVWNFIVDARKAAIEEVNIRGMTNLLTPPNSLLIFDLGLEDGGKTGGQWESFMKRLWQDYTYTYGVDDTVGFSIAWAQGRFAKLRALLESTYLPLPKMWAVDVYANSDIALQEIYNEMGSLKNQPLIITETYFNDALTRQQINNAMQSNDLLNISMINQWPNQPGGAYNSHFTYFAIDSLSSISSFSNYISLISKRKMHITSTNADYLGVKDLNCASGANFPCNVELVWRSPPPGKRFGLYIRKNSGYLLVWCLSGAGRGTIPWIATDPRYIFDIYEVQSTSCASPGPRPNEILRATAEATPF